MLMDSSSQPTPTSQPPINWQPVVSQSNKFSDSQTPTAESETTAGAPIISWTASEFIAYQKTVGWFALAFLAMILVVTVVYFVTKDTISTTTIVILGLIFLILALRKPRVLNYSIDDKGIRIGDRLYGFSMLKSFAIMDEGSIRSIDLMPTQRFLPAVTIYYDPTDESTIINTLSQRLPMEDRRQPLIDRLMHRIRF